MDTKMVFFRQITAAIAINLQTFIKSFTRAIELINATKFTTKAIITIKSYCFM